MISKISARAMLACAFFAFVNASTAAAGDTEQLKNYPNFALGDQKPLHAATCAELRTLTSAMPAFDFRIDLAVTGPLTSVQTDGALWYLVMCELPDAQVMCVTYQDNGMNPRDVVTFGGGYTRLNEDQIMLDPCLASAVEGR